MKFCKASIITPLLAPALLVLMFGSCLLGVDRLAFRDVSHFFTPLFDYVAQRQEADWLPLWNPLDQTGIPLIGETTTAVLYPVRYLVFSLPISSECAVSWYVVLHLILASLTSNLAARWSGAGLIASAIASVIYSLSGSLLFLYCNPPFLVGAAWLPLVVGATLAASPMTPRKTMLIAGAAMSMMILGGDPHTALHAMIVITATWVVLVLRRRSPRIPGFVLIAVPLIAAVLSAPQIAASISWSGRSDRLEDRNEERWFDPPLVGSRRHESYQFSVPPWHFLNLATPNAFGFLFPQNQRVSQLIPGDGRMWTPTVYMGVLALIVWLIRIMMLRSTGFDRWFSIATLAALLAMGHFGMVWLIQATTGWWPMVDSAVGGPYWFLYTLLPGYDSLRYPAKWLPLFALGTALMTARIVDRQSDWCEFGRIAFAVALASAIGMLVVLPVGALVEAAVSDELPTDEFWGPLNIGAGFSQIRWSLFHSTVAAASIALICGVRRSRAWPRQLIQYSLLAVVLVDLTIHGHALIARVDRGEEKSLVQAKMGDWPPGSNWLATKSASGWPQLWTNQQDPDRMVDVEASGRLAWFGRWHLTDRVNVLNNMVSIRSREMAAFWKSTRRAVAVIPQDESRRMFAAIRQWLSISGVLHRTEKVKHTETSDRNAALVHCEFAFDELPRALRHHVAWTSHVERPASDRDFDALLDRIRRTDGEPTPTVSVAGVAGVAEAVNAGGAVQVDAVPAPVSMDPDSMDPDSMDPDSMDPDSMDPDHAQFDVRIGTRSLLSRPVYQDGHWKAEYAAVDTNQWTAVPVHQVDYLKQGVLIPAGHWKVRFRYAPWWLGWAIGIALVAWIGVAAAIAKRYLPMQNRPKTRSKISSV